MHLAQQLLSVRNVVVSVRAEHPGERIVGKRQAVGRIGAYEPRPRRNPVTRDPEVKEVHVEADDGYRRLAPGEIVLEVPHAAGDIQDWLTRGREIGHQRQGRQMPRLTEAPDEVVPYCNIQRSAGVIVELQHRACTDRLAVRQDLMPQPPVAQPVRQVGGGG